MLQAHESECPGGKAQCPHCKEELARPSLSAHLDDCPEALISCPHSSYGCAWQGQRKVQSQHISSCPYEAIKGFFAINEQRHEATRQENLDLRRQLSELQYEVQMLRERPFVVASPDETLLPPIVGETADRIGQLLADTDQLRSDLMNLSAGFSALEMRQDMALLSETARLREEMHSVRALCQAVQSQLINFVLDRRKESSASTSTSKAVLSSAINALTGGSQEGSSSERETNKKDGGEKRGSRPSQARQDSSTKL